MLLNGVNTGKVTQLTPDDGIADNHKTALTGVTRIEAADRALVVVPATLSIPAPNSPFGSASSQTIVLFDDAGQLVKQLGGTISPDQLNGDTAVVVSLGTADTWFACVSEFDAPHDEGEELRLITRIYLLEDEIPLAVTIRHRPSDISYGIGQEPGEELPVSVSFNGENAAFGKGIGQDGSEHAAALRWDAARSRFEGPSRVTREDRLLYEVLTEKSECFAPTDRSSPPEAP